jgi:hypothetical protein
MHRRAAMTVRIIVVVKSREKFESIEIKFGQLVNNSQHFIPQIAEPINEQSRPLISHYFEQMLDKARSVGWNWGF